MACAHRINALNPSSCWGKPPAQGRSRQGSLSSCNIQEQPMTLRQHGCAIESQNDCAEPWPVRIPTCLRNGWEKRTTCNRSSINNVPCGRCRESHPPQKSCESRAMDPLGLMNEWLSCVSLLLSSSVCKSSNNNCLAMSLHVSAKSKEHIVQSWRFHCKTWGTQRIHTLFNIP